MPNTNELAVVQTADGTETALVVLLNGATVRMTSDALLAAATGQQTTLQAQLNAAVARILALEGASGPSAPNISTTVTISDTTPNVGDTLTASGGTPAGGSGSYTTFWQWYLVRTATGPVTIPGANTSSLPVISSMTGAQIVVFKWVVDSNGVASAPKPSALTTAVGGTQSQSIALTGLPAQTTTVQTASISWTLSPSGGTVFCRLDAYAPAAAPNPFVLGSGTALSVGVHKVDFYVSAAGDGTDVDPALPLTTYSWTIIAAPAITLFGLPSNNTTSTGASIGWTLTPAGSAVVYWRRDGQTAAVASTNPIVLTSLSVGSHTVDFYTSANGTGSDNVLRATYTWTIAASGVVPLSQLAYPVNYEVTGYTPGYTLYDGTNALVVSAVTRLGPVVDASGVTMDIHRIVAGAAARAEGLWIGDGGQAQLLRMGHEYWYSFVIERTSGELLINNSQAADVMIAHQTHSLIAGDTQPELALVDYGFGFDGGVFTDKMAWRVSGNDAAPVNGETTYSVSQYVTSKDTRPAAGVKWRYVVRIKCGWAVGHDKIVQIWRGKPGEDMANITLGTIYTGINAYNDGNNGLTYPSYIRKGIYKWDAVDNTISYKISRLYFEENLTAASATAMLDRATEAVAWAR
jgi:hypothetical protein